MSECRQRTAGRLAALGLVLLVGCGQPASPYDANVQGTVTIDGELAPGGSVTFSPKGEGPVATGVIGRDGSFVLKVGQGAIADPNRSLIPAGEYVAAVVVTGAPVANPDDAGAPPKVGPRLMADKYASKSTSGLEFTVRTGANVLELKLDGPSANPPVEEAAEVGGAGKVEEGAAEDSATEGSEPRDESAAAPATDAAPPTNSAPAEDSETPAASGEEAQQ